MNIWCWLIDWIEGGWVIWMFIDTRASVTQLLFGNGWHTMYIVDKLFVSLIVINATRRHNCELELNYSKG